MIIIITLFKIKTESSKALSFDIARCNIGKERSTFFPPHWILWGEGCGKIFCPLLSITCTPKKVNSNVSNGIKLRELFSLICLLLSRGTRLHLGWFCSYCYAVCGVISGAFILTLFFWHSCYGCQLCSSRDMVMSVIFATSVLRSNILAVVLPSPISSLRIREHFFSTSLHL